VRFDMLDSAGSASIQGFDPALASPSRCGVSGVGPSLERGDVRGANRWHLCRHPKSPARRGRVVSTSIGGIPSPVHRGGRLRICA
jgi:hypothetical protein